MSGGSTRNVDRRQTFSAGSMIPRSNASFWAAINQRGGDDALGMLERQRVKSWLKTVYAAFDALAV